MKETNIIQSNLNNEIAKYKSTIKNLNFKIDE
jgi:hypothetical protein